MALVDADLRGAGPAGSCHIQGRHPVPESARALRGPLPPPRYGPCHMIHACPVCTVENSVTKTLDRSGQRARSTKAVPDVGQGVAAWATEGRVRGKMPYGPGR